MSKRKPKQKRIKPDIVPKVADIQDEFAIAYLKDKNQNIEEWVARYAKQYDPDTLRVMFRGIIALVEKRNAEAQKPKTSFQMGVCSVQKILTISYTFFRHTVIDTHYGILVVWCPKTKRWTAYNYPEIQTSDRSSKGKFECFDCRDSIIPS